jgi:hypothetical protein
MGVIKTSLTKFGHFEELNSQTCETNV